jgi:hypothetical protein
VWSIDVVVNSCFAAEAEQQQANAFLGDFRMVYETFVKNMVEQFPFLREECLRYMDEDDPLPYIALGVVFIPFLEDCLKAREEVKIGKACAFIEAAAADGNSDFLLNQLIGIEIGEWIRSVSEIEILLSHLGPNTKRACRYHIARLS